MCVRESSCVHTLTHVHACICVKECADKLACQIQSKTSMAFPVASTIIPLKQSLSLNYKLTVLPELLAGVISGSI